MAAIRRKSDLENIVAARAGMQNGAPPPFPVRIDEIGDRSVKPRLCQCIHDKAALPRAIARKLPMLNGTAAAGAEMRANRRNALATGGIHRQPAPPVGLAPPRLDLHPLAR